MIDRAGGCVYAPSALFYTYILGREFRARLGLTIFANYCIIGLYDVIDIIPILPYRTGHIFLLEGLGNEYGENIIIRISFA